MNPQEYSSLISLSIVILAQWYLSIWATLIYIFLFSGLMLWLLKKKQMEQRLPVKVKQVERQQNPEKGKIVSLMPDKLKLEKDALIIVGTVPVETSEDDFLIKLRAYIGQELDNPNLSIEDICKHMTMSRSQLHRKTTAMTGCSITIFVRNIRLQHAQHLLTTTKMNVSEVAYETGFSNLKYFGKVFKQTFGKSPSEFQK